MTLMEQVLVIAVVASLVTIGIPTAKHLFNNMETTGGVKNMIGSTLSAAKAMAAREQQYVGIRFQHALDKDDPDKSPLTKQQYMIYIQNRPPKTIPTKFSDKHIFTAIEGIEPIKLPDNIGVMDYLKTDNYFLSNNSDMDEDREIWDISTFSIIFSPSGKIVHRFVQVRNRDDEDAGLTSEDDIFNTRERVDMDHALFLQDNNTSVVNQFNLYEEQSRQRFFIYDRNEFKTIEPILRWTNFMSQQEMIYINPYTGTFIER